MGLGAYLAAVTDRDHYLSEEKRERLEVAEKPEAEREEVLEILEGYGIGREASKAVVKDLCLNEENWIRVCFSCPRWCDRVSRRKETWKLMVYVQFMMDFELKLEKPNVSRAWISAATMGLAYFIGIVLFIPSRKRPLLTGSRWSNSYDTLFRHDQCHARALRLDWHYFRRSTRLRLCQELRHDQDKESWVIRCYPDAHYWNFGCRYQLWYREGCEQ